MFFRQNRENLATRKYPIIRYLSLFFAISNVLNNISPWQKNNCFQGKLVSATRKLATFANCSNPASPILIVEGSVYTRNILSFIPAEDIDQIKLAFTYRGLKPTGGSIRWMQPTSGRTFCRCTRRRSRFAEMMQRTSEYGTENDATDFLGYYPLKHFVDIL